MSCQKNHTRLKTIMAKLPVDQGGAGRHKCAACAYDIGFDKGCQLDGSFNVDQILNHLDESQAGTWRHKSPHAAFAQGYLDGVKAYYGC